MITVFESMDVNGAWTQAFDALVEQAKEGNLQDSRDGAVVGEILNACFNIKDPTRNIVTNPVRSLTMRYAIGELAWYLSKSNRTRDIAQFAPKWEELSDDGTTNNSAYGFRIFEKFGFDQWEHIKQMLTDHPDSRQAVIHIKEPNPTPTKDMPCTVYLQFILRDNKLHLSVHMRSNDIWMGVPYDMFSFCFLQILMAMELGVGIGEYTHYAGSLHLYKRNYETALKRITEAEVPNNT